MNESSRHGYQEGGGIASVQPGEPIQPSAQGPGIPAMYKFSSDELRVISECNKESFYQRSLPLGTLLGVGTMAAVKQGFLKPSPRFGAFPKVTLAVVFGYFVGKMSYQQACAEKLMALPGSYIGQVLRDRRDGKMGAVLPKQTPTMFGAGPSDVYSDAGPGSSLDLDTERPLFSEDTYRPDNDLGAKPAENLPARPSLSYEELRRKNRSDFTEARQDPYRVDPSAMPPISRPRPSPPPASSPATNKYGDVME